MNDIYVNRFSVPITTGTAQTTVKSPERTSTEKSGASSFDDILQNQIRQNTSLTFSKHAASRVVQRDVELSADSISRLDEGVRLAQQKGLNETLIIVDKTAFIVSVKNSTVVTTVQGDDLKGNIFTNIDGTVII